MDQNAFLILFDLTDEDSLYNASKHNNLIQSLYHKLQGGIPPTVLVGTKKDLASERKVDYTEAERIADALNCPYIETSAKAEAGTGGNVDKAFELAII